MFCAILLLIIPAFCECLTKKCKSSAIAENVGKFRRDIPGRLEFPGRVIEEPDVNRFLLRNCPFNGLVRPSGKNAVLKMALEKYLTSDNPPRQQQLSQGFRNLIKEYFKGLNWRSVSDQSSQVHPTSDLVNAKAQSPLAALNDKFKTANIDYKNRFDENVARFSEPERNFSREMFTLPEGLKLNSRINDLISQSLFSKPVKAEESNNRLKCGPLTDPDNLTIIEGVKSPSSNFINFKMLLNKNLSDVISLNKPDIPSRISSLTILDNKSDVLHPFRLISKGDKTGGQTEDKQIERLMENPLEKIYTKPMGNKINDMDRFNSAGPHKSTEEDSIKSARRLLDVLQNQMPLDILNIPNLLNSFKTNSNSFRTNVSSFKVAKKAQNSTEYPIYALPVSAQQKSLMPEDVVKNKLETIGINTLCRRPFDISKPLSLRNESKDNGYIPLGSLTSILTKSISKIPLLLIPLNRITLDSILGGQERALLDTHANHSDVNDTLVPLAKEMNNIFNYQDVFSRQFGDLNLKDLIDLSSKIHLPEKKKSEINILSLPTVKKHDVTSFQKRVEDFLKLSRLNVSEFHGKMYINGKNDAVEDNKCVQSNAFSNISNSIQFSQEVKKSRLHDRAQNILPLLKVTANMALSKYSNVPIQQDKISSDIKTRVNGTFNLLEATASPNNWISVPIKFLSNSSANANIASSFITEMNRSVSTETSVIEKSNEINEPNLQHILKTALEQTVIQATPGTETNFKNESDFQFQQENVANSFILQQNKDFEKSMKADAKNWQRENFAQNISSLSVINLSFTSTESASTYPGKKINLTLDDPSLDVDSSLLDTNVSSGNSQTISKEVTPANIEIEADSLNPKSDCDTHSRNLPFAEGNTSSSSVSAVISNDENKLTTPVESMTTEENSITLQGESNPNSPSSVALTGKNGMMLNLDQIKELLSAMLTDESRDNSKYAILQAFNNVVNQYPASSPEASFELSSVSFNQDLPIMNQGQPVTPITSVKNSAAKKKMGTDNRVYENQGSEEANYYISNKTRQNVEESHDKGTKSEMFQIPGVLIEILNRMESSGNNSSGYNMVFVPDESKKVGRPLKLLDEGHDTSSISDTPSTYESTESVDNSEIMKLALTTELSAINKTDNIYQIVTMRNIDSSTMMIEDVTGKTPSKVDMPFFVSYLSNLGIDNKSAQGGGGVFHSQSNKERPIILVAIDPLKSYKNSPDPKSLTQHLPLGIIIKSASLLSNQNVQKNLGNRTIVETVENFGGQPQQNINNYSYSNSGCTTPYSTNQCKLKEVTLFPIYPMYPVYPVKPIIASNVTSNQSDGLS